MVTHIGLDVHKETIAVATLRPGAVVCEERTIPNTAEALRKLVVRLGDASQVRACYEAGPTGYYTHRLRKCCSGRSLSVDRIGLSATTPHTTIRTVHLDHTHAVALQIPREETP